jgi:uncharacterized protein (DUF488 family)
LPKPQALQLPSAPLSVQRSNHSHWNSSRSPAIADFFTIGYSGRSPQEFIESLAAAGVRSLIDIRFTPISQYRPEFSKGNLRQSLESRGIAYVHRPDLGVPRDIRGTVVGTNSRAPIWDWYDKMVVPSYAGLNLDNFFNSADHPVAFMCTELDPTACHRHRLAIALEHFGLRGFDL